MQYSGGKNTANENPEKKIFVYRPQPDDKANLRVCEWLRLKQTNSGSILSGRSSGERDSVAAMAQVELHNKDVLPEPGIEKRGRTGGYIYFCLRKGG